MSLSAKLIAGAGIAVLVAAGPSPPKNTGPKQPGTENPSPCGPSQPANVTLSHLAGRWTDDDTGETLTLLLDAGAGNKGGPIDEGLPLPKVPRGLPGTPKEQPGPGLPPQQKPPDTGTPGAPGTQDKANNGKIYAIGRHYWSGTYDGTTLNLSRYPSDIKEMDEIAPDWAKTQALNKVKWELELNPKTECGELVLEGKWYPGSFKWRAVIPDNAPNPNSVSGTISDIGRGTAIKVKYRLRPPKVLAFATAVSGLIMIDKFYQNVPTVVGVFFDSPYGADEYQVSIKVGQTKLDLTAKPIDSSRKVYYTEPFKVAPR
jgi:hypothetical protein